MSRFWPRKESPAQRIERTTDRFPPHTTVTFDDDGQLHSVDGRPAVETADGYRAWYTHGKFDRGDDQPAVIDDDGYRAWYTHGKFHRDGGPAVIWPDGAEAWYQMGRLHRINGPALVAPGGGGLYFLNGKHIAPESYSRTVTARYGPLHGPPAPDYSSIYEHDFD